MVLLITTHLIARGNRCGTWVLNCVLLRSRIRVFFHIDEHIDQKTSRNRSSTAIITVVRGQLTAKQIELEFRNIVSHEYWKWSAKALAKNKFAMRFPNSKMVHDYSKFKLGVKEGDELMVIEPWKSSMGTKGPL